MRNLAVAPEFREKQREIEVSSLHGSEAKASVVGEQESETQQEKIEKNRI